MKKLKAFIIVALASQMVLTSCGGGDASEGKKAIEASTTPAPEASSEKIELIIDAKTIINKSLAEVEAVLGKAENTEKVKGYPCEKSGCEKSMFKAGKYEIYFKNGKADRININSIADLTTTNKAIEALGFEYTEPAFMNAKTTVRWNNVAGTKEISFFTDYVLIQVSEPE